MISIPDVEAHIQEQLTSSPIPTSRKVGVPPKSANRSGIAIPKRTALSVNTTLSKSQARQVQIFDSQPLISPSSSSWSSQNLFQGLTKMTCSARGSANPSALNSPVGVKAKAIDEELRKLGKQASTESELSDLSSGPSSMAISCSVVASSVGSPPSSVGSLAGALDKLVMKCGDAKGKGKAPADAGANDGTAVTQMEKEIQEATCSCIFDTDEEVDGAEEGSVDAVTKAESKRRLNPPSGPSLLSQTAPPDLHRHKPHCSTLCKSPADVSAPVAIPNNDSLVPCPSPLPVDTPSETSSSSPTPSAAVATPPISIKIADLGNATPLRRHYTEDIQTRQYRSPEAITGRNDWGDTADIWSFACVIFELLTAEYLFDPQSQGELFGKDDDHCAQIIELMGPWPEDVLWGGRFSREIFDSNGECPRFSSTAFCTVPRACSVCGERKVPHTALKQRSGAHRCTWASWSSPRSNWMRADHERFCL